MMLEPDQVLIIVCSVLGTALLIVFGHFTLLLREQLASQPENEPTDYVEAFRAMFASNSSTTHPSGMHH